MVGLNFLDNVYLGRNEWWKYIFTLVITVVGSLILGNVLVCFLMPYIQFFNHFNHFLFSNIISISVVSSILFILFVSMRILHKRSFLTLLAVYKSVRWWGMFEGGVAWFLISCLTAIICFMLKSTCYSLKFTNPLLGWFMLVLWVSVSLSAFTEEVIFHGYLLQAFSLINKRPLIPLLATSFIFSVLHYSKGMSSNIFLVIFGCFLFSLVLGWIVLVEGGLETAIGTHVSNNLFTTILHTNPLVYTDFILITVFQLGLLIVYILYFKRKIHRYFFSLKKIKNKLWV